ncbi:FAD-linked oxidoreductase hmp9 [Colletotrichum viniferum]|nr:FAD-linked oxidoreductase hmp9 [Colletotrichum viniferum]
MPRLRWQQPTHHAPGDACWPSPSTWDAFNTSISGKLIATNPVAISCYPGPDYNPSACASVQQNWFTGSWQSANPVGLDYPLNITCPPPSSTAANSTATGSCSLGTNPPFAVNVTSTDDIVAALRFARRE